MWLDLALVAGGAFLAAVVIGSAGFAFAIVVTGIWIYVMPPQAIVLLAATCATLVHTVNIWQYRRNIEFGLLWPFLAGALLGVPMGVLALTRVDTVLFRHLFGAFMIAYAAYMLARPRLPVVRIKGLGSVLADGAIGWLGGWVACWAGSPCCRDRRRRSGASCVAGTSGARASCINPISVSLRYW